MFTHVSCILQFRKASFKSKFYWIKGKLKITNNLEALTGLDRNACLKEEGEKVGDV